MFLFCAKRLRNLMVTSTSYRCWVWAEKWYWNAQKNFAEARLFARKRAECVWNGYKLYAEKIKVAQNFFFYKSTQYKNGHFAWACKIGSNALLNLLRAVQSWLPKSFFDQDILLSCKCTWVELSMEQDAHVWLLNAGIYKYSFLNSLRVRSYIDRSLKSQ